jgi:CubicO group peptidase (beta-lactamase class C family)
MKRALLYGPIAVSVLLLGSALLTAGLLREPAEDEPGRPVLLSRAYAGAAAKARPVVRQIQRALDAPGAAFALALDGEIVWSECFGEADRERGLPVRPSTRFRIGSVSKPLTAAALARLLDQGKLDLDAPVQKYVPAFPDKGHVITARQLAGHLSGIRNYRDDEVILRKPSRTTLDALRIFQGDPLLHPPGTRFFYSTWNYTLLSAVIEGASGREYLAAMQRLVLTPLRLRHTAAERSDRPVRAQARPYERTGRETVVPGPPVEYSAKWAGGGFLSTAEDLVRFGAAHLKDGFLKRATRDLLFTSQRTAAGAETGYGVGWEVARDPRRGRIARHIGHTVGGSAFLLLYPDAGLAMALVANVGTVTAPDPDFGGPRPPAPTAIAEAFFAARENRSRRHSP